MKKHVVLLIGLVFLMLSCSDDNEVVRYRIASHVMDCYGEAQQVCLLVKRGDAGEWTFLYSHIEGFTYDKGYEYIIDVEEEDIPEPMADASSVKYTLVREISKVKKTSEGLPEDAY